MLLTRDKRGDLCFVGNEDKTMKERHEILDKFNLPNDLLRSRRGNKVKDILEFQKEKEEQAKKEMEKRRYLIDYLKGILEKYEKGEYNDKAKVE